MKKKNTRKIIKKENKLKQKILEINLSKATIITSTIVIIVIALITAKIIKTINESSKEKVEIEEGEEYSPVNWIESTEIGEDGNYKKIPVPKGYVASQIEGETTVNGGFVIYEDNYNGKSINWDEIIIKDDGSSSGASVADKDEDKKEKTSNLETPAPEIIPTEDVPVEETAMSPEDEERQEEQEEQGKNKESTVSEENAESDEEGTSSEERTTSEEPSQGENGVVPQADGETEGEGEPTEPEISTAEKQTKKNIFDLQQKVNQYVWVPVPDISRVCGVDANGKLWGKLYNFNDSGPITLNWTETEGKMTITNKTGSNSYREPDVTHYKETVKNYNYDVDGKLKRYMYGETEYEMLSKEMEQNFYETMKSIEKYGGYYIGRYETGIARRHSGNKTNGGETVVRKMQYGDYCISNQTWYESYIKNRELAEGNENIKTSMIWGNLWDETLKWLVESGAKTTGTDAIASYPIASQPITYSLINNSTAWGSYRYSNIFNYIPNGSEEPEATAEKTQNNMTKIPTGSAEYTKANNIYDMAGNVKEWTLEAQYTSNRIRRGGGYRNDGSSWNGPVRDRYAGSPTNTNTAYNDDYGSRAILTIR